MLELFVNPSSLDQTNKVTLDEVEYSYRLYWNSFYNRWYMDWFDVSNNPLSVGTKIAAGQGMIKSKLFKGSIVVLSINDDDSPPKLNELGKRVKLIYVTEEELGNEVLRRPLDEQI